MIRLRTTIPGPKSTRILTGLKNKNGGWGVPHPFVHSHKGKGVYTEDIDGNRFLDFGCQIASNPLGYNNSDVLKVVRKFSRKFPVKYAGQDFATREHLEMIESLTGISPRGMNAAFLVNSGAEAVENAIKICMRRRPNMRYSVSVEGAFHGRTLGALSLHHSNPNHRKNYILEPNLKVPFSDNAGEIFEKHVRKHGAKKIGFFILEHLQGEGGYRIPTKEMVGGLYRVARKYGIPYIADEVQAGMGRTGKWWSFEHYGIKPDVFSSAKALQVGACVASKEMFPNEAGAISSTWGGGHVIDLVVGMKTIEIIKRDGLLKRNSEMGGYIQKKLSEIDGVFNVRGRGLMIAFDVLNSRLRDNLIIECIKNGLILLGAGERSVRIIPPYVVKLADVDLGLDIIERALTRVSKRGFKHTGRICGFMGCGDNPS